MCFKGGISQSSGSLAYPLAGGLNWPFQVCNSVYKWNQMDHNGSIWFHVYTVRVRVKGRPCNVKGWEPLSQRTSSAWRHDNSHCSWHSNYFINNRSFFLAYVNHRLLMGADYIDMYSQKHTCCLSLLLFQCFDVWFSLFTGPATDDISEQCSILGSFT